MANALTIFTPSKKRPKPRPPRPRSGPITSLTPPTRMVLAMVAVFTLAFIGVIGMKLHDDRRDLVAQAVRDQAQTAAAMAERAVAAFERAQAATAGAAQALEVDWDTDGEADILAHLAALSDRDDISHAVLLTDDGQIRGAVDTAIGALMIRAAGHRGAHVIWDAPGADGGPDVYVAGHLSRDGRRHLLVARVELRTLGRALPIDGPAAIVGPDGMIGVGLGPEPRPRRGFAAASAFALDEPAARAAAQHAGSQVVGMRTSRSEHVSVVTIGDTDLAMYVGGPLRVDPFAWRQALMFYFLLLLAPLLVEIGLSAVLIMQNDNIKTARKRLSDSENRLNLAIEAARCGVWDWDVVNDQVYITESLARMLGQKRETRMSRAGFEKLVREDDRDRLRAAMRDVAATGDVDVEFRAKDLPYWLHVRGRPWIDPDGHATGRIVGVAIDVTEQKGAQARVAAAETRLMAALESMSESFVLWDSRRRLVLSNQKFREFLHLEPKHVKPGAAYEMLDMAAQDAIKETHAVDDVGARELELADGRWIQLSERRTADGGLVSIGTDITALKRKGRELQENERALRKTVAELTRTREHLADVATKLEAEKIRAEQASRAKSDFLAHMSHELRTPLNAINGFSEIMIEKMYGELGDSRYEEYAHDIHRSGLHLLQLITDILDMSKIEAGKRDLDLAEIKPEEMVEQCVRLVRSRAKEAELELTVDVGELPTIRADGLAIKQVLLNLLTNAIKFTLKGGRVELRARKVSDGVVFQVEDTGIGIAEEDLPRLGRPFEQISNDKLTTSNPGSGLGLALSKSLVEMHGGDLAISSRLDVGTIVTFTLPFEAAYRPEAPLAPTGPTSAEPDEEPEPLPDAVGA